MVSSHSISTNQLDTFRNHFQTFSDQYVLIGGIASQLLLEESGFAARTTKDLDIVLCIEALTIEFVHRFWKFIRAGEYECWRKSNGDRCFYRFEKPMNPYYPYLLELLSERNIEYEDCNQVTLPLIVEDDIVSLSAIMLNKEYYQFIMRNRREINGIMIVNIYAIIPLKVRAFLDLSKKKDSGHIISSSDINKHKNDVLRLTQLLNRESLNNIHDIIKNDILVFCDYLNEYPSILKQLGLRIESIEVLKDTLITVYC